MTKPTNQFCEKVRGEKNYDYYKHLTDLFYFYIVIIQRLDYITLQLHKFIQRVKLFSKLVK